MQAVVSDLIKVQKIHTLLLWGSIISEETNMIAGADHSHPPCH